MAKQRNALRAGIFMIASLALIIYVIIAISGAARFLQSFKTYQVKFSLTDDVGGLRSGDDVRIGGFRVGNVRDIRVEPDKSAVIVFIEVPSQYTIAANAHVQLQQGLTGGSAINIDNLGSGAPLGPDDFLTGNPSTATTVAHALLAMGPDLRQTVSNLKTGSGKLNTDLDAADSFLHTWRDFLGPSSTDFHQTIANLDSITTVLRDRIPGIVDHVQIILSHAAAAMIDIQSTAAKLTATASSLRSLLVDNHSKLEEMIESLKQTSDNLKYASVEIRHSPWRLLYKPRPDEVANLNIYDSVRQFAEGADSLDDAASALRDALKDPAANRAQLNQLMQRLDDCFSQFQGTEQKLWTDIKE